MLTPRENLLACIRPDGKPDRYVNQWEAYEFLYGAPFDQPFPQPGGEQIVDEWGVTKVWPSNAPGPFPVHDDEHIVVKDFESWKDYVKAPKVVYDESAWELITGMANAVDRKEKFVMVCIAPGIFEQIHNLCEISNTLTYFYEYPDEMHDCIKYMVEHELNMASEYVKYVKPDAIDHHDDWGTQLSTFMSPDMFAEFFVEPYKEIYKFWHDHGVEIVLHHSDSFGATLIPYMIEMGIDIWQGVLDTNDIPSIVKQYGGQISFHGGINNGKYDVENFDPAAIHARLIELYDSLEDNPMSKYFIGSMCTGGPAATYPGVYECVTEEIARINKERFGL